MIMFIKNRSWSVLVFIQHLSLHPPICLNICSLLRTSLFYRWSMYAFHLAANEREMERLRKRGRQTERERWLLVIQQGEMSRCGETTARRKQRLLLPWIKIQSLKWSLQSSCRLFLFLLALFFSRYNSSHRHNKNWINALILTSSKSFLQSFVYIFPR